MSSLVGTFLDEPFFHRVLELGELCQRQEIAYLGWFGLCFDVEQSARDPFQNLRSRHLTDNGLAFPIGVLNEPRFLGCGFCLGWSESWLSGRLGGGGLGCDGCRPNGFVGRIDESERRAVEFQARQVGDQFLAARVTVRGILGEHLIDHQVQTLGHIRLHPSRGGELAFLFGGDEFQHRRAGKGEFAGEEVVERGTECVDIGAAVDILGVACLLGGHVKRGAQTVAALCHRDVFVDHFREAEVGDFHDSLFGYQNVIGLDVAMDDVQAVCFLEGLRADERDVQGIADGKAAQVVHPVLHALAIDVFDGRVIDAAV